MIRIITEFPLQEKHVLKFCRFNFVLINFKLLADSYFFLVFVSLEYSVRGHQLVCEQLLPCMNILKKKS